MLVTLILATYGRAAELERCLGSLAIQTDRNFEVLIMDQNPDDRLAAIVERYRRNGLLIRHEFLPKPGLSEARNQGIHIATGEVIGFPDDDCWYEPGTVAAVKRAFELDTDLSGVVANWVEQTEAGANKHGTSDAELSHQAWRNFRGGAASSISLFMKRSLLLELHGFDTRFGVGKWYGAAEETDLVLRALSSGAHLKRQAGARVHHAFTTAGQQALTHAAHAAQARARGTGAIYAKHKLSMATILRGLVAPLINPLVRLQVRHAIHVGFAVTRGRLEGMRRWRREES